MDTSKFPSEREFFESAMGRKLFPNLAGDFEVLAPATIEYNCIAHALGLPKPWINPKTQKEQPFSAMDGLFHYFGFSRAERFDPNLESGIVKLALYAKLDSDGAVLEITHAARQEPDGLWSSKMGQGPLIKHRSLESLAGSIYGEPVAMYVKSTNGEKQ